jgi:hypothetical protein
MLLRVLRVSAFAGTADRTVGMASLVAYSTVALRAKWLCGASSWLATPAVVAAEFGSGLLHVKAAAEMHTIGWCF